MPQRTRRIAIALVATLLLTGARVGLAAEASLPKETKAQHDARMAWWRDARFGMFIHWGLYAVPAGIYHGKPVPSIGEWIMNNAKIPRTEYAQFAKQFNPVKYDPDLWAARAAEAGMKYVVITSKHHDGFCLWGTKQTTYNVVDATPYGKDLLKPLAEACRKHGIHFCVYYSIMDWHHPAQEAGGKNGAYNPTKMKPGHHDEYINYVKAQLKELVDEVHPEVFWFDGEWPSWYTEADGREIYTYLRQLEPDVIINNRVGKGRKGMEGFNKGDQQYVGDFGTPEQHIPPKGLPGVDWESCMTMNDTWGYKKNDHHWKSAETLIRNLCDIASKGGNYLLNVGPMADGEFPPAIVERLAAIGTWMHTNHEAIYGTTASPFDSLPKWGRVTTKGDKLYVIVFDWPKDGKLTLPGKVHVASAHLLAAPDRAVTAAEADGKTILTLPGQATDPVASVIELDTK